jgi:hypothetical protein
MPKIAVYFEKRDMWIGCYWLVEGRERWRRLTVYICLVPCFPIRLRWQPFHV